MLRRIALALVLIVSVLAGPASADHSTGGVHWPGAPEGYVMVSNRSAIPAADIHYAMAAWDASPDVKLVDVGPVCPGEGPHFCLTIYEGDLDPQWGPDILGTAVYHVPNPADRHILAADVWIRPGLTTGQRRAMLVHEFGHGLGLNHSEEGVMAPFVWPDDLPTAHDFAELAKNRQH